MTESKAREFVFQEPVELQEWYDIGADIRINIRKQFHKAANEINQLQAEIETLKAREIAHLALIQDLRKDIKAKDELLRECEEVLEKYETMTCVSGPGLTQKEMWAARTMIEKLREGKK